MEAKLKAAVHCVIIGFSKSMSKGKCRLYRIMEPLKKRYKLVRYLIGMLRVLLILTVVLIHYVMSPKILKMEINQWMEDICFVT